MSKSYQFIDPSYEDFLIHSGRLGMKWHVRNFENYDGTLTPAGKERYSVYWKKGTNLKGKKVDYGRSSNKNLMKAPSTAGRGKEDTGVRAESSRSILDYQKADGSLTPEGKKKYGDILTEKEMQTLVRNYNSANGTNYRVGDVSFRKNGKLYSAEGKRVDEDTKISKTDTIAAQTKPGLFGGQKELSYKEKLQNVRAMSDEDLKRGIERSKLEKAYIEELGIQKSRGEKFIDNLKTEAASAATEVAKQAVKEAGDAFLKKYVLPKLSKTTGISQEELSKGADKLKEAVDKGIQAQQQKAQQQAQQTQQKPQQGGNQTTTSKPIEQTSNKDLREMVRKQKNMSEESVNKMSRDDLIKTLKSSGGSGEKPQASAEGKLNPPSAAGTAPKRDYSGIGVRTADTYSPTHNSRPVDYWTREQLKNYIGKSRGYDDKTQRQVLDMKDTDELIDIVRKIQESND